MKVYLVRHGESWFNRHYEEHGTDPGLKDPSLTPEGAAAAEQLATRLAPGDLSCILTSPLTRALQTATAIAGQVGAPVRVDAKLRERHYFSCDIGTERSALVARWPGLTFHDFEERWWAPSREVYADFVRRTSEALSLIEAHAGRGVVCVVTHSGVIEALTGAVLRTGEGATYGLEEIQEAWAARRAAVEGELRAS